MSNRWHRKSRRTKLNYNAADNDEENDELDVMLESLEKVMKKKHPVFVTATYNTSLSRGTGGASYHNSSWSKNSSQGGYSGSLSSPSLAAPQVQYQATASGTLTPIKLE